MKGVFLNVNHSDSDFIRNYTKIKNNVIFDLNEFDIDGCIIYKQNEWDKLPYFKIEKEEFFIGGWFILDQKVNDITGLKKLYKTKKMQAFAEIELGNFVIIRKDGDNITIISDLVSLSTHYYMIDDSHINPCIRLSPSLTLLDKYTDSDPFQELFLSSQGHLIDNYTCLNNVFRLTPASELYSTGEIHNYINIANSPSQHSLSDVPKLIKRIVEAWPKKNRALAISGGLDSRLMLASSSYSYGYTYGPEGAAERIIARKFKECFNHYYEYSIAEALDNSQDQNQGCAFYFQGVSNWLPGLIEAYQEAKNHSGSANTLFDGYLGDIFQRGNYLKFGGMVGSILKILPILYKLPISAKYLMRKRYKNLNNKQFHFLWQSFQNRTKGLPLDKLQKITYYELFYGRGGRYVINGGNITANQIFTIVPVFMSKNMLELLLKSDFTDAVSYKNLSKIWQNVDIKYKTVRSDSGISPMTLPILAPFINIAFRFFSHYAPWMSDYADEIKDIKTKKSP